MLTGVTEAMGLTKAGTTARLRKVLEQYGLPTDVDASAEDLIPYISNDKKMRGNHMTLIILKEIGKGRLLPLAAEDLPKYNPKEGRPMNVIITPHTLQGTVEAPSSKSIGTATSSARPWPKGKAWSTTFPYPRTSKRRVISCGP